MAGALAKARAANALAEEKLKARSLRLKAKAIRALEKAGSQPSRTNKYDASTRTRLRPGPRASGGSAAYHLTDSVRSNLARDCQDLERNSTIARIVIRRAEQLIVGDGPVVTSADPEADRLWNLYFDATDPELTGYVDICRQRSGAEILAGIVGSWCTAGGELVVLTNRGSLQTIEAERLITPGTPYGGFVARDLGNGRKIISGVEVDAAGAPLVYHVADWTNNGQLSYGATRAVSADYAMLVNNPIGLKTGLVRGEPALQAVLARIERLDMYDEKVAAAAEIATLYQAIVRTRDPAGTQAMYEAGSDQPAGANPDRPRVADMEAGVIHFMSNTDDVVALDPKFPTTNFRDYVLWHLMLIGAELGLPLVATLFDASQLSWSNIKALLNLSMRSLEPAQARLARLVRWVRSWKVRQWQDEGLLSPRDDYDQCEIMFPRAPVVDFKSEVEGYLAAINGRVMTRDQASQALGTGKFSAISAAAAAEEKALADLGIPAVNMPGASGAIQPSQAGPGA